MFRILVLVCVASVVSGCALGLSDWTVAESAVVTEGGVDASGDTGQTLDSAVDADSGPVADSPIDSGRMADSQPTQESSSVDAPIESGSSADGADEAATRDSGVDADSGPQPDSGPCDGGAVYTHQDGLGQTWQDCAPAGTYDVTEATRACEASGAAQCATTGGCAGPSVVGTTGSQCYGVWEYGGPSQGLVRGPGCTCPDPGIGGTNSMWN